MKYIVKYDDGKYYSNYPLETREEAEKELAEAIEDMDGDNWCGLHIEEVSEDL